ADGTEQPCGEKIWEIFYLRPVPYDRAVLCHSPMCHCRVYGGHREDHPGKCADSCAGSVLSAVFCRGAVLFPAPGRDTDVDREGPESAVPSLPGTSGRPGAALPDGEHFRDSAGGSVC